MANYTISGAVTEPDNVTPWRGFYYIGIYSDTGIALDVDGSWRAGLKRVPINPSTGAASISLPESGDDEMYVVTYESFSGDKKGPWVFELSGNMTWAQIIDLPAPLPVDPTWLQQAIAAAATAVASATAAAASAAAAAAALVGAVKKSVGWTTAYVETPGDYTGRWNTPGTGTDARPAIQAALDAAWQQLPGGADWYKWIWRRGVTVKIPKGIYVLTAPTTGSSLTVPEGVTLDCSEAMMFFDYPAAATGNWSAILVTNSGSLILPKLMTPSRRTVVPAANPGTSVTRSLYDGVRVLGCDNGASSVTSNGQAEIKDFYGAAIRGIGAWVLHISGPITLSSRLGYVASNWPGPNAADNVYGYPHMATMPTGAGTVRLHTDIYFNDGVYFLQTEAGGFRGVVTGDPTSPHDLDYTRAGGMNTYFNDVIFEHFASPAVFMTGTVTSFDNCAFEQVGNGVDGMARLSSIRTVHVKNHRVTYTGGNVDGPGGTDVALDVPFVWTVAAVQRFEYEIGEVFNGGPYAKVGMTLFDGTAARYWVSAPDVAGDKGIAAGPMYNAGSISSNMMPDNILTALNAKQALDTDLTTIAALDSSTAGALVTDGAGWIRKSYAALKLALNLSIDVRDYGAVSDDPGDGTGTNNRAAFQAAFDAAIASGKTEVLVPGGPAGTYYQLATITQNTDYGNKRVAVIVPPGLTVRFLPGARVWCKPAPGSVEVTFLLLRAHGAKVLGLVARGPATTNANMNGVRAIVDFRSKGATVADLDVDGILEGYQVKASLTPDTDTVEDAVIQRVTIGPKMGAGLHFFGVHRNCHLDGLHVKGTLRYDALQVEPDLDGPYTDASENFVAENIVVDSCAARGVFINPFNKNITLRNVRVRNAGRLADGTLIGYDQGDASRVTVNAGLTISQSSGTFENIDIEGSVEINPTAQPAVAWSSLGPAVNIIDPQDIVFRGRISFANNAGGDIMVDSPAGYNSKIKGVRFENDGPTPSITYGTNRNYMPPVTSRQPSPVASGYAPVRPMNLLPSWNLVGPDGARVPWLTPINSLVDSVTTGAVLATRRLAISGAAGGSAYPGYEIDLGARINLAKGHQVHVLMLGQFDAPASTMSWYLGGLTGRRKGFQESVSGRLYQAGALRWMHSVQVYDASDTFTGTKLTVPLRYNNAVESLDVKIEALWVYVTPVGEGMPVFDFAAPQVAAGVPTIGTWPKGAVVLNANPTSGASQGWVCTAAGTPGTWKPTGVVDPAASFQAADADLTTIAAIDSSQSGALVSDGSGWIQKTYAQLKTALALVKGDVGLGSVDNTSDASKPVSTAQQAALDLKIPTSRTIAALALTADITASALKTALALVKGDVGLDQVDNTSDANKPVSTATQTALDAKTTGPASAVSGKLAAFNGTTGKVLYDSNVSPNTNTDLGGVSPSNGQIPTQLAVKTYVDSIAKTMTNTRLRPRVLSIASSATPAINTDLYDAVSITALAAAITSMSSSLTGTPQNFEELVFRIKDDGTGRAITWGASFEPVGVALPTTTVANKRLTTTFRYDSVTAKWGCIASVQEA